MSSHASASCWLGVDLVGDDEHGPVRLAQQAGDAVVLLGHADGGVDHEQDHVGLRDGPLGLAAHLVVEPVAGRQPAAGVDEREGRPFHSASTTLRSRVTPGLLLDDRLAPADDAVHERRLADVGPPDDGHHGRGQAHAARAGRRSDTPSVATTSTGRGRSAGEVPSRKRPCDRHTSGSR